MLLLLTFVGFCLLIIYWYLLWFQRTKHLKKYLSPPVYPIVGHTPYFLSPSTYLGNLHKIHQTYGSVVKLAIGFSQPNLVIADPKFLEFLLGSTTLIEKSTEYQYLYNWLGTGLLTSGGTKWRNHRKIITPAFHFQILQQVVDVFNEYSQIMVEKLKPETSKTATDIYQFVTLCTLDIISASAMGTKLNIQKESNSEYLQSVKTISQIVQARQVRINESYDTLYQFTKNYQSELKALKVLHGTTKMVINSRREQLKEEAKEELPTSDVEVKKKKPFLDILLNYQEKYGGITDENIREEVDTFMFEGHDTTSSGITFTLYCLSRNPIVQEKVIEELAEVLENDFTKQITYNDVQSMKYLEMVVKESMRLFPPVPFYSRKTGTSVMYDGDILPKGLALSVNTFSLHRDPQLYPDPERFDPERFSQENQLKRSPYAYVPFSAGSRNCIGQKYAMMEVKTVVANILINYELLPSIPEVELALVVELVLKSQTGVHMRLKQRKW